MDTQASSLPDNPFANLERQIADLAANSFQIKPGAGLYVLAATLSVAAILFHSGILSALPTRESAPELEPTQNSRIARYIGLLIVITAGLGIAYVALSHTAQTRLRLRGRSVGAMRNCA
jgi:hypothetical protein